MTFKGTISNLKFVIRQITDCLTKFHFLTGLLLFLESAFRSESCNTRKFFDSTLRLTFFLKSNQKSNNIILKTQMCMRNCVFPFFTQPLLAELC